MPQYRVETRATVVRHYLVDAADEKAALEASNFVTPIHEEDEDEEMIGVVVQADD